MAVYERGYRSYDGGFGFHVPALTIWGEGMKQLLRGWGIRSMLILQLVIIIIFSAMAYVRLNLQDVLERLGRQGQEVTPAMVEANAVRLLEQSMHALYLIPQAALGALMAIIVGSVLISTDLSTRSLTLYMARPIRRIDYVMGKALILPTMLLFTSLLPGFVIYNLFSLWQGAVPYHEFFFNHFDTLMIVVRHFLVVAMSYTGLMLLLSSRTPRVGVVKGIAALVLFAGTVLAPLLAQIRGGLGDILKYVGLPYSALPEIQILGMRRVHRTFMHIRLPDIHVSMAIAFALLLIGIFAAWHRARSTEVTG